MKRKSAVWLSAFLLLFLFKYSADAAQPEAELRLSASASSGYGGNVITLTLNVTAENMGGFQTDITWKGGYLTYIPGSASFDDEFLASADFSYINDETLGVIRLVYGSTRGNTLSDSVMFKARFRLTENTAGTTTFSLTNTKMTTADESLEKFSVTQTSAKVQTKDGNTGQLKVSLSTSDSAPKIGDTVKITLKTTSSTDDAVGSLQGTITFDPNALSYVPGSMAFSTAYNSAATAQFINVNHAETGELKFVYSSVNGTKAENAITLSFTVIGSLGQKTYVKLQDVKATNNKSTNLAFLNVTTQNASLTPEAQSNAVYYTTHLVNESIAYADTATVQVLMSGITAGALQFTIDYDAQQFSYVENSAAFTAEFRKNASVAMVNDAESGKITVVATCANGYTPDGSAVFQAEFVLNKCGSATPIAITGIKTTNTSSNPAIISSKFIQGISWDVGHAEVIDREVYATHVSAGLTEGSHCSVCGNTVRPQLEVSMVTEPMYLPACLTEIEDEAFMNSRIENAVLPETLSKIGENAFAGNENLRFVGITNDTCQISETAFDGCSALLTIVAREDSAGAAFAESHGIRLVIAN